MKIEFPSLFLENIQVDKRLWATADPFPFLLNDKLEIMEARFLHDKYSVPRPVQFIFPQNRAVDVENIPAVVHDYVTRHRVRLGMSLLDCHAVFRQAMGIVGISRFTRYTKWAAVVVGAWTCSGKGDGTPPPRIQAFIEKNGWGH